MDYPPGSGVRTKKQWREWVLSWVERHTGWAATFTDERWFVLWPRQASTWARRNHPHRIAKDKRWKKGQTPPSTCWYADLDATTREVTGEWHQTWNQHETWAQLKGTIRRSAVQGGRFLLVFWDHAP